MFKNGFISSDMYDAIKTSYWNSRKKFNYEFAKWLQYEKFNLHKRRYRDDDLVKKETKPNYNDNENIIVDMNDIRK